MSETFFSSKNVYLDDVDVPRNDAFYHIPLWTVPIDLLTCQVEKCAYDSWLFSQHQFHHAFDKEDCKAINMRKMIFMHRKTSLKLIEITIKFIQCVYAISQLMVLQRLYYLIV